MLRKSIGWEWIKRAFHRGVGLGDLLGSIGGNAVTAWIHLVPTSQNGLRDLIWQVPVFGLAGGMLWRLIVTPVEMVKEARGQRDLAQAQVRELTGGEPIRDRIDVISAALYMNFHDWNHSVNDLTAEDQIYLLGTSCKQMVQDTIDGRLDIWVRRERRGGNHVKQDTEYWENHHIDWVPQFGAISVRPNAGGNLTQTFEPLVRKSDIERLYGPAA